MIVMIPPSSQNMSYSEFCRLLCPWFWTPPKRKQERIYIQKQKYDMSKEGIEKKGVLGKAKGHKLMRNVFFPFTLHLPMIYTFVHLPTYG